MMYGHKKENDQIANNSGKGSIEKRKRIFAEIFTSLFTKAIYAVPVIRHSGSPAVFKDRLSRYHTIADRFFGFAQSLGVRKYSALFYTLLCRKKVAKKRAFENLLASIFKLAKEIGLIKEQPEAAIDSTGLETHHISSHFVACTKRPSYFRRKWPKVTVICDTETHLIGSCIITGGPGYDFPLFEKALCHITKEVEFARILADAGYDSENNHQIGREVFGMETIIALNHRRSRKAPSGTYRKEMNDSFNKEIYNHRWQVESVFSRNKRLLGSALRNRSESARQRECLLRALTHNLMIIRRAS
jgi:hypothetical protein